MRSSNWVTISSWRFSKSTKFSEQTCGISGSWFAMKRSSKKSERNLPRNTNSNWSRRSAATFTIHGATAFRSSIFTTNHSYGFCLTGKRRKSGLNSVGRDAALWRPDGAARRPYYRTDLEAYVRTVQRDNATLARAIHDPTWRLDHAESLVRHANNRKVWLALFADVCANQVAWCQAASCLSLDHRRYGSPQETNDFFYCSRV